MRQPLAIVALALLTAGCRTPAPLSVIDPALSSRVPPATIALAFADLDQLRVAFPKLPANLEPFRDAHAILVASTGAELLTITRRREIALLGAPALIDAANAPHPPAPILAIAEPAAHHPIWVAIRGGTPLPLTGNLANANNLITLAESLTLTADVHDAVSLELTALYHTPAAALQFEQRLRALLSLTAAASHMPPAEVRRDDRTVTARMSAPLASIQLLLQP